MRQDWQELEGVKDNVMSSYYLEERNMRKEWGFLLSSEVEKFGWKCIYF